MKPFLSILLLFALAQVATAPSTKPVNDIEKQKAPLLQSAIKHQGYLERTAGMGYWQTRLNAYDAAEKSF